jgi:hypothetical protein
MELSGVWWIVEVWSEAASSSIKRSGIKRSNMKQHSNKPSRTEKFLNYLPIHYLLSILFLILF